MFDKPFVILDVGSNHRGSLDLALRQIEAAKECGADAVKFQLYTYEELYGLPGKADYELPRDWIPKLKEHADKVGIEFMCTAFSVGGYHFIDPYVKIHKVASSEMLHVPILDTVKAFGKPWIVSTGGAHQKEIDWVCEHFDPTVFLECVANYPAEASHYNLYNRPKGVSDHTLSGDVSLIAARLGATVFERHFDIYRDRNVDWSAPGYVPETPDRPVSVGPKAMTKWVKAIHEAHKLPKDQVKRPDYQDQALLRYRRRPIVTRELKAGDRLVYDENYGLYRSLVEDKHGARAQTYLDFNGKTVKHAMKPGQSIWVTDIIESEEKEIRECWSVVP